ncbi:hypothetical protein D9M69_544860 [compost metagenome]
MLAQREHERGFGRCHRQHLERDVGEDAQRAHRPGQNAADVVTRHVFHHLATEGEPLTAAVDELHAEHVVAHTAGTGARRAGQSGGDRATDGGRGAKARWFKRQALALFGERRFEFNQRCAGPHRHHQLARLVAHDTGPPAGGHGLTRDGLPVKGLGVATDDAQGPARGRGGAHLVDQLAGGFGGAGTHGRHRSGHTEAGFEFFARGAANAAQGPGRATTACARGTCPHWAGPCTRV